ncbi:FadR/GntR family transcriptional regulator [Actinacidiphila yeochonensis]|uniref:FadR/GntR family transcriptional regulator n=1 Tax=Actinacidiphila yeochonensis TaxID=89050 RepID=UPI00068A9B35|nr:FCD domain-containing protein [Actinacidiphila yeochonensis]
MTDLPDPPLGGRASLEPLHAATTGEQVAHRLATAVALGEYSLGDRLPSERELAALLGVSRESVRVALRRLSDEGLLEIRRGRAGGAFVRAEWTQASARAVQQTLLDRWEEFEALFDYRRLVEGLIARTAADRADAADRAELRRLLADFDEAPSPSRAREIDTELHLAVARAAHNPRLVALHRRLLSEVSLGVSMEPYTWDLYERSRPGHHHLVDAVCGGDGDAAARIAHEHFGITEDVLRRLAHRVERTVGAAASGAPADVRVDPRESGARAEREVRGIAEEAAG